MFDSILDLIYNPDPTNFEMGLLMLPSVVTKENIVEFTNQYKTRYYRYVVYNRYDRITDKVANVLNTNRDNLGWYFNKEIGKVYEEYYIWWQRFSRISNNKFEIELCKNAKYEMEFNENSIHRGNVVRPYFPNVLQDIKEYHITVYCKTIELKALLFNVFENVETLKIRGKIYFKNINGIQCLKKLKTLDMRYLKVGGSNVYFELPQSLETLILNTDNLQNFKEGFFKQIPNLKKLCLLNSWYCKLNSKRFLKELPQDCEVIYGKN